MNLLNLQLLFLLIICVFYLSSCGTNTSMDYFYFDEIRSLSELPLKKLIKIKSTFAKKAESEENTTIQGRTLSSLSIPFSIPLKKNGKYPIQRSDDYDEKSKDSKISKIFQLTVTALSFLAFGGYLLTLIITAIRRGQNVTTPASLIVVANRHGFEKRPKREFLLYNTEENNYDTERLYNCMIMMSNAYRSQYSSE